ncbi:DUF294 nucleotidyltransferase-like domain-containing protein [Nibricoccus sp. IMCC34717]|uniref:DUF294 nucleotidyltransferase-like domain-containing protein n=1 Tax=Nibricoccus sp. IMCC34717 TaxID=3034021 RepID=UPI00384F77F5
MTSPSRNLIPGRIADSLKRFPPFSMLAEEEVRSLAAQASVTLVSEGDCVWKQGDRPGAEVHFLARGRVEYLWAHDGRSERVDVRDVGDVLGLSAHVRGEAFRVTAKAVEDSLFYGLPWKVLGPLIEKSDSARHYVRRHLFWVVRVGHAIDFSESPEDTGVGRSKNILQAHLDGAQVVQPRPQERLLSCTANTSLLEAASRMRKANVPSILVVDAEGRPLGIVSATNLVQSAIVDGLARETPVSQIMTSPVITVSPGSSATAAILQMLRHRINQVCVTEDGSRDTRALDVATHKDLLAQNGHHPAGLLRELRYAETPARFRELCDEIEAIARSYLEANVSSIYVGQICAELYDEFVHRLLELAQGRLASEGKPLPEVPWAWMSVGSDGRREQILRTDMDNAFVFASSGNSERDEEHRARFMELAGRVIEQMAGAGFARCQGGVMALNPRWCRTDREWAHEVSDGQTFLGGDGLVRATVLFDLRHVAGSAELCTQLRDLVFQEVGRDTRLQRRLAEAVVDTAPPLNFIGRLVVEAFGGRDELLDIKSRGMAPLRDAARLFALKYGLSRRHSTGGRFEELRRNVPARAELAVQARDAYDFLLRLRTLNGLRRGDSGRHLDPSTLSKIERTQLSSIFDVVRSVQQAVKVEFHVDLS